MTDNEWNFRAKLYRQIIRKGRQRGWPRDVVRDDLFKEFRHDVPGGFDKHPEAEGKIEELLETEWPAHAGGGAPVHAPHSGGIRDFRLR